jgi:hypothetical protein
MRIGRYDIEERLDWDPVAEYLYVGRGGESEETGEGNLVEFEGETGTVIGVTFVYPAQQLEREGGLFVTLPDGERVRVPQAEAFFAARA